MQAHQKILSALVIFLFAPTLQASNTPSVTQQISQFVTTNQSAQLSLLAKLVNINSGTTNLAGVHQVGEILRPKFEALGFSVHWAEEPANMQRAGTLVTEHHGHSTKRLLLIGHLDTVFAANSSFKQFKQTGNTATGPGVVDIKGGDVVMLSALAALNAAGALQDANITVILTGDEEDSGKPTSISRKPLIDAAKHSDVALDFEQSLSIDTATIARRGIASWTIQTEGNEAHSSEIFQARYGFGAIFELTRILDTMQAQLANEKYLSFSPGLILGGTTIHYDKQHSQGTAFGKGNVIAKSAMAKGDLRFLSEEQKITAEKNFSAITSQHLPGTSATISFQDGIPSMSPTAANQALLNQYSKVSVALGYGEVKALDPGLRGAGDISHIAAIVPAALAGLGPVGTGTHSAKETLDVSSLPIQTKRAALLIYSLLNPDATLAP